MRLLGVTGSTVVAPRSAGGEWLAMGGDARGIPQPLAERRSFEGIQQSDFNRIVGSFRNVWSVGRGTALPSSSMSASMGGNDPVFGRRIGYLASATYAFSQDARLDLRRAVALPGAQAPGEFARHHQQQDVDQPQQDHRVGDVMLE